MVQKQPLVEDSYVVSSKRPKFEDSRHLVSFLEFPFKDVGLKPYTSGKGYDGSTNHLLEPNVYTETCNITDLPKECTENSPGGNSNSSWASSCTSEEDLRLEAPFHISVPPENNDPGYPSRTLAYSRDSYARLLELPPQKLVPIGPDFQAEVPEWCPHGANNTFLCPFSVETVILSSQTSRIKFGDNNVDADNKFLGICLNSMPSMESIACDDDKIGYGRIVCSCVDTGSVTCTRQHVVEAREDLRRMVGQECLGLHEMGEVVAEKWSEEDKQVFEEVVISNPSSTGKNFWDRFSAVFPSRTKMEIVSYYFNVFMLQKRAKQNRSNSMNIDSDDDEWQESGDEFVNCEDDTDSEEDEVSDVESPACRGIPGWSGIYADAHEYGTGVVKDLSHQYNTEANGLDVIPGVTGPWQANYYGTDPMFSPSQRTLLDVWGDHDLTDHSRTSSGTGTELQASKLKAGHIKSFAETFNGAGGHEFYPEPCDAKVWDFGYASCRRNDVEFFPTCSVIEEVFGVGDSNNRTKDDKLV